jgi:predicted phosphodiesterase
LIFIADPHIRHSKPKSRTDDFLWAQDDKLNFICKEAQKSPPLIIAGDLLHKPHSGPWVEQYLIKLFDYYDLKPIIVPGQHDLLHHSLKLIEQSSIGVLEAAGVIIILTKEKRPITINGKYVIWGCAFGEVPDKSMMDPKKDNILIWHHMVVKRGKPLWEGQISDNAETILRLNNQYKIICTGDNHQTHLTEKLGRVLINPGSITRQSAIQIDHRPCFFKWEDNKVEQVFLPIESKVLNLSKLEQIKEKEARYGDFIDKLHTGFKVGIDLNHNFISFFEQNKIRKSVENLVWSCIPDDK